MKRILTSVFVTLTILVSCGKDEDSPTPNTPDTPNTPEKQEVKKIKEVQVVLLKEQDTPISSEVAYSYKLVNKTISYEYDTQGRVSKIIEKEEGKTPEETTISYESGKIIVNFEGSDKEFSLNAQGYLSKTEDDLILYDEKGQLSKWFQAFHWENGNLSQITEKKEKSGETNITKLSYYPNENKNKFLIFDFEGDLVNGYLTYFGVTKALPIGVPTKNLVKIYEATHEHKDDYKIFGTTTLTTSFSYMYDADGYVTDIIENRKGVENLGISRGSTSEYEVTELEQLMAGINNGTIKNKTYKVHQNGNGIYKFEITHNYHITKDVSGKVIDVKHQKFEIYQFNYTEANGVRNYTSYEKAHSDSRDASTTYKIIYQ
ncbi:sugar-binding protein [Capnocytophaga cynodegmi]|uniref:sugar-binding protein n=1 Tax=Capnocytophaga cynodegmi TaxID=28189 RepID=UPI0037D5F0F8